MTGVLFEEDGGWSFLVLTLALGGATAYLTGRAVARSWRPTWTLVGYVVLLALALRFLHFALFDGAFFSISSAEQNRAALHFLLADFLLLMIAAAVGWRITRTNQMTMQYRWLYVKTSPFSWRGRAAQEISARG